MPTKALLELEVERLDGLAQERKQELVRVRADQIQTVKELKAAELELKHLNTSSLAARASIEAYMAAHYSAAQFNSSGVLEEGNFSNGLCNIEEPSQFEANGLLLLHIADLLRPAPAQLSHIMDTYGR